MNEAITERLAEEAHKIWADWMAYMFSQGTHRKTSHASHGKLFPLPRKSWVMPEDKLERWTRQMETDYQDLSEEEKESDREIAQRYLEIIEEMEDPRIEWIDK